MAQHSQDSSITDAVELQKGNSFDALSEAVTVLMNSAMVAQLMSTSVPGPTSAPKNGEATLSGSRPKP